MSDVQSDVTLLAHVQAEDDASAILEDLQTNAEDVGTAIQNMGVDATDAGAQGSESMSGFESSLQAVGEAAAAVWDALSGIVDIAAAAGGALDVLYYNAVGSAEAFAVSVEKTAYSAGLSDTAAIGLIDTLVSFGATTDQATGMIQRMEMRLGILAVAQQTSTGLSKVQKATLADLGITADQLANGNIGTWLPEIITKFGTLTNSAERSRLTMLYFGMQNTAVVAEMVGAGAAAFDQRNAQFQAMYGTTTAQNQALLDFKNAQNDVGMAIEHFTGIMAEALLPLLASVESAILAVSSAYSNLSPSQQKTIQTILELVAVFGPLIAGPTLLTKALTTLAPMLGAFGIGIEGMLAPVLAIAGPVLLLVAAFLALKLAYDNNAEAHRILTPLVNDLQVAIGFLENHMQAVELVVGSLAGAFVVFNGILLIQKGLVAADIAVHAIQAVVMGEATAAEIAMAAGGWLAAAAELAMLWPIALIVLGIAALIAIIYLAVTHTKMIGEAFSWLGTQAKMVWGVIVTDVIGAVNSVIGFVTGLWTSITTIWNAMITGVESAWSQFTSRPIYWIVFLVATVMMWISSLELQIGEAFVRLIDAATTAALNFVQGFIGWIQKLPSEAVTTFNAVINAIGTWAIQLGTWAYSAGTGFVNGVINVVTGLPGQVGTILHNIIQTIITQGPLIANQAALTAGGFVTAILNALAGLPNDVAHIISSTFSNVAGQVTSGLHDAHVPGFATGGFVPATAGGILARIGEGGEDEVVTTATQMAQVGANLSGGGGFESDRFYCGHAGWD